MTIPPISPAAAEPAPRFSWPRALLHALLAMVAVVVVTGVVFGILGVPGSDSRKVGEAIGRLVGFIAAVAFGASWMLQTRRRKAALGLGIAVVVLVASAVASGIMSRGRYRDTSLTAAEKAPLVIADEGGERRLRHPGFGFSILHPGPKFVAAPELVQPKPGQKHDDTTQEYGFIDRESRSVLLVSVMKGMGGTREQLDKHVEGVQRGFAESLPPGGNLHWGEKQVTWTDGQRQARLNASFTGGMRLELAAYSVLHAGQEPFIVNVMIVAPDADRYTNVTTSLRP